MSQTLELLSPDHFKNQYREQFAKLANSLNETIRVLKALQDNPPDEVTPQYWVSVPSITLRQRSPVSIPPAQAEGQSMSQLIRLAGKAIRKGITRGGVEEYIESVQPGREFDKKSLSALLSQIAKEEGWVVVEHGIGGKQTTYDLP